MNNITEKLQTHVPSLLPKEDWPMSKGPWEYGEPVIRGPFTYCPTVKSNGFNICDVYGDKKESTARFIAACNDAEPLAEKMWRAYNRLISAAEIISGEWGDGSTVHETQYASALELLETLDRMNLLRWTPKEETRHD